MVSEGILGITGLIILWYTWETSEIRKAEKQIAEASKEGLERRRRPIVATTIYRNPKKVYDTLFIIRNLSEYEVAVRVNCNFKINGEIIKGVSPSYDGSHYWNMQYREEKQGHFSWLDLLLLKGLISRETNEELKKNSKDKIISLITKWKMLGFF